MQKTGYERYLINRKISANKVDEFGNTKNTQNYTYYRSYDRKISRKKGVSFAALFILSILLVGLAMFFNQTKIKELEFYFIEAGNFLSYKEASMMSFDLQSKQGAGYIYYDGSYHVLVSYYKNSEDAESVLKNIDSEYPNAKIFTISANEFKQNKSYEKKEKDFIQDYITENYNQILAVNNQIISYDKNEIKRDVLELKLKNIYEGNEKIVENFKKNLKNNAKFKVFIENLQNVNDCYDNLCQISKREFEPYMLKYELVKLVNCHVSFLSCL